MTPSPALAGSLADMLTRVLHAYEAEVYDGMRGVPLGGHAVEVPLRREALSLLDEYDSTLEKKMTDNSMQTLKASPDRFVRCYVTAKRIHAKKLIDLRSSWPGIYFTAKWPIVRDLSFEQTRPAALWLQDNVDDILRSEAVVCYAEEDDAINGSIWELGVAWAHGKPIYLAGENAGFKEWRHAPRTRSNLSLDQALKEVTDLARYDRSDADRIMGAFQELGSKVHASVESIRERMPRQ